MNPLKSMKQFIKDNYVNFLISCGFLTIGAFFIHLRFNHPVDIGSTLVYLPAIWFGAFILMCVCGFMSGCFSLGDKR